MVGLSSGKKKAHKSSVVIFVLMVVTDVEMQKINKAIWSPSDGQQLAYIGRQPTFSTSLSPSILLLQDHYNLA